ncbi:Rrf2 family transcriptional regulator [Oscillospiraceae bacterium PP1C4]
MKISTKGRYALRLMLELAINHTGECITIKSIAARQEISEKYLEQIITNLVRAGYVKSVRGAQGGYILAHEPSQYTVGMILRLMEGSLAPVVCLEGEDNRCLRADKCVTLEVWKRIDTAIEGVVDHMTLADLVEMHNQKIAPDYCI